MSPPKRTAILLASVAACGFPRPPNLGTISGRVHGLWDGTDGVALRLQADGIDTLLTVSTDGAFTFAAELVQGASYTVTVAANPVKHACVVDAGGNGTVADTDITNVSIACTGPALAIGFSGQWGWTFDPSQDTQMFAGSIVVQDVGLTVSGDSLTSANISGIAEALGKESAPIALPLGSMTVPVALTASGGLSKIYQFVFDRGGSVLDQVTYGKASNTGMSDAFGYSVALSGDTLAVGAFNESSSATGVNPLNGQSDNNASGAGAVYVFVRAGTMWIQQAYIKASNTAEDDEFGWSVALSGDTLVVGAPNEDKSATGVNNPNQTDEQVNSENSGAAYVFVRNGTTWTQQAYVKASNTGLLATFGWSVALSGNTLVVGSPGEANSGTGVNPSTNDSNAFRSGAVYVFVRSGTTWTQQAYVKASNTRKDAFFGSSVALSIETLAVGAPSEDSSATGVNGDQTSDAATGGAGAVYVFVRNGTTWAQQAYVKASNTGKLDQFGSSVALSGETLAVGASAEDSNATGVNGSQGNDTAVDSGAVYVFIRNDMTWTQQAYVKASNTEANDRFGSSIALSGDTLAIGAPGEASNATGVNGNQSDNAASDSGAVYVFVRNGTIWTQQSYVKASNTGAGDGFGNSVALSGDTLVAGADFEYSGATGVNGNQADNSVAEAGAIYIFR